MDDWKQRLDRLASAGYLKHFTGMAQNTCAPFWWSSQREGERAQVVASGTVCFVNTGERHLAVTADHVYAGYLEALETEPAVECQFGSRLSSRSGT